MQLATTAVRAHCCLCSLCWPPGLTPIFFSAELFCHYNRVCYMGIMPPHMQNSVELHEAALSPVLQFIEISPNISKIPWCISHPSFFSITCKLTESTFCSIFHIIHEDVERYCSSIDTWETLLGTGLWLIFVLLDFELHHSSIQF